MKDSGVPWLGEVPEHWATERAKWLFGRMSRPVREADEVITCFRDGVVTLRKNRRTSGFTESLKEIGYQGIRRGDLVIHAMDAFAGSIGVSDSDGKGTPVYLVCSPKASANSRYYAYAVREMAASQWIQAHAKGIRERSTDFRYEAFGTQEVPLPPLPEQEAIVRFLDHAEGRIRRYIGAKQRLVKLLEEQRQAIVHQAVTRGLDPTVPLKPSGIPWLGDIPADWEVKRIRSCLVDTRAGLWGDDPTLGNSVDHVICLRVADFDVSKLSVRPEKLTLRAVPGSARAPRLLSPGDILLEKSGGGEAEPVGRVVLYDAAVAPVAICSNFIVRLRPNRTAVEPRFLLYILADMQASRRNVPCIKQTTGIQNLDERAYLALSIGVPPVPEQEAIVKMLEGTLAKVDAVAGQARREIELLREYRARLIADVVTGKVDVRAHPWANTEPEPGDLQTLADLDESDADGDEALLEDDGAGDDER